MLEDLLDHFFIFDESDDSHLPLAFGTGQGINLINFFESAWPSLFDTPLRSFPAPGWGDQSILGFLLPLPPRNITVIQVSLTRLR
jgi:hypothetical protein